MAFFLQVEIPGTGRKTTYPTRNRPAEVGDGLMGLGSIDDRWECIRASQGFSVQRDRIFGGYVVCEQLYVKAVFSDGETALDEYQRRVGHYRNEQLRRLEERKR